LSTAEIPPVDGIAIAAPQAADMPINLSDKLSGGLSMTTMKRICTAILLVSLLALAGCPEMVQQGGGSSSPKEKGGPD